MCQVSLSLSWTVTEASDSGPFFRIAVLPKFSPKQGHSPCALRRLWPPKKFRSGQAVGYLFSFPVPIHVASLKSPG